MTATWKSDSNNTSLAAAAESGEENTMTAPHHLPRTTTSDSEQHGSLNRAEVLLDRLMSDENRLVFMGDSQHPFDSTSSVQAPEILILM